MADQGLPRLFHPDVFMPRLRLPDKMMPLRYGHHALNAARNDKYGDLTQFLPTAVNPTLHQVVEAEVTGNRLTKLILRIVLGNGLDLCLCYVPNEGFVKTVWANETNDEHKTLNRARYATEL